MASRWCVRCGKTFTGYGLEIVCDDCRRAPRVADSDQCHESRMAGKCETQSCGKGCDLLAGFRQTWAEMEG